MFDFYLEFAMIFDFDGHTVYLPKAQFCYAYTAVSLSELDEYAQVKHVRGFTPFYLFGEIAQFHFAESAEAHTFISRAR
jgi:hypothetical protein